MAIYSFNYCLDSRGAAPSSVGSRCGAKCGGLLTKNGEKACHLFFIKMMFARKVGSGVSFGEHLMKLVGEGTEAELTLYANPPFTTFDPSKLYITDENARYLGGDFHDGWVTGHIRELSSRYEVAYDDQPPTVNPITLTGDILRLSVTDGKSGIAKWTATIDDRFIVFDAIEKSATYACFLRESWLRRSGTQHRQHLEVTDDRQNTRVFDTTFEY